MDSDDSDKLCAQCARPADYFFHTEAAEQCGAIGGGYHQFQPKPETSEDEQ